MSLASSLYDSMAGFRDFLSKGGLGGILANVPQGQPARPVTPTPTNPPPVKAAAPPAAAAPQPSMGWPAMNPSGGPGGDPQATPAPAGTEGASGNYAQAPASGGDGSPSSSLAASAGYGSGSVDSGGYTAASGGGGGGSYSPDVVNSVNDAFVANALNRSSGGMNPADQNRLMSAGMMGLGSGG